MSEPDQPKLTRPEPEAAESEPTQQEPAGWRPPTGLPLRNLKLIIAYDGSAYHGWQRQRDGLVTIQGVLESALARIVNHPVDVIAAGRTDSGVHALGQVGNFRTIHPIPADRLLLAVNSRLPEDIAVRRVVEVPSSFHATRDAVCKLYRYTVHNQAGPPVPDVRRVHHWYRPVDLDAMRAAASLLLGRHDFSSFESAGSPRADKVRTLLRLDVFRNGPRVQFDLSGDGFLYNMARILVGTLLEVGRGHWPPEKVVEILAARDRRVAGPLAPASGLCLRWVQYPPLVSAPTARTQTRTFQCGNLGSNRNGAQ